MHFSNGTVDKQALFRACQELVDRNEILRTVFVRAPADGQDCYGVVIRNLSVLPVTEYLIEPGEDVKAFASRVCYLDSQTRMPYGSSFVKWFLISNGTESSLAFRLSHAQYDEICLPVFLHQFHQLYQGASDQDIPASFPFSKFVAHTMTKTIPAAIPYWKDLLDGSEGITPFRVDHKPILSRKHFAIERQVDISSRSRDVTVATLPSAAWALALARRTGRTDVVFGEVASGRGVDIPGVADANSVGGPCWQYVPTRVNFARDARKPIKTGMDLLLAMQEQHMATSAYDSMGLEEIVRECTEWTAPSAESLTEGKQGWWFDTVVHQDVAHVEKLSFSKNGGDEGEKKGAAEAEFETIYPFEEPLREWKVQAFRDVEGNKMVLEVITFESWREEAEQVLSDVVRALEQLVQRPWEELGF